MTEPRIHWSVTLWGPRAADDPHHSVGGSGSSPEEAVADLLTHLGERQMLLEQFREWAEVESERKK